MCEERWNKLLNESNGVIPLAAFRDAVNLDVLHFVSILFSSLCSSQQFLLRVHCTSLQGVFSLRPMCSFSQPSQSCFFDLNIFIFDSKCQDYVLEKCEYICSSKLILLFDHFMFCSFCLISYNS